MEDRSTTLVIVASQDSLFVVRTVIVRPERSRDRAIGLEPVQRPRQEPSGRRAGYQPSREADAGGGVVMGYLDRAGRRLELWRGGAKGETSRQAAFLQQTIADADWDTVECQCGATARRARRGQRGRRRNA